MDYSEAVYYISDNNTITGRYIGVDNGFGGTAATVAYKVTTNTVKACWTFTVSQAATNATNSVRIAANTAALGAKWSTNQPFMVAVVSGSTAGYSTNGAGLITYTQAVVTAAGIGALTNGSTMAMTALPVIAGTGTITAASMFWTLGTNGLASNTVVTVAAVDALLMSGFFLDFNRGTNSITFSPLTMTNVMTAVSSNTMYHTYWGRGSGQTIWRGNGY
jgi:hypothetical protein